MCKLLLTISDMSCDTIFVYDYEICYATYLKKKKHILIAYCLSDYDLQLNIIYCSKFIYYFQKIRH
jgi:hypothetical protein